MTAGPIPGKLYIDPTDATTGGTQVVGIAEDAMVFDDGRGVQHFGSGLESDAWTSIQGPAETPPKLVIPLRDISATTLQLLFSMLSTGTGIDSHGGNSVGIHGNLPSVALVIRPKDTTQDYFYGPRWKLHQDSVKRITWSRNVAHFDGSELALCPQRSLDGTKQAFKKGTASAINTAYGL